MEFVSVSVFMDQMPLAEALRRLAAQGGAPLVEVWAGNPAHFRPWDWQDIQRARAELNALGMRAFSLHAPFSGSDDDLAALKEPLRQRALRRHRDCVVAAAELSAEVVVIHPGQRLPDQADMPADGSASRAASICASVRSIRELAEFAEKQGVRLAVESLPPSYLGGQATELIEIVDGVRSSAVGVCLDTGHTNLSGNVADWVRAIGPRIVAVHMHDNHGADDHHLPPGDGNIDWPAFAQALREVGYRAPITFEVAPAEGRTFAGLKQRARQVLQGL